jgi:hypothetical protein
MLGATMDRRLLLSALHTNDQLKESLANRRHGVAVWHAQVVNARGCAGGLAARLRETVGVASGVRVARWPASRRASANDHLLRGAGVVAEAPFVHERHGSGRSGELAAAASPNRHLWRESGG